MIEFIKNYWKKSEFFSCLFLDLSKIEPRSKWKYDYTLIVKSKPSTEKWRIY